MKVFNVPSYLEDLTGLTQLLQDTRVSEVSKWSVTAILQLFLKRVQDMKWQITISYPTNVSRIIVFLQTPLTLRGNVPYL